MLYSDMPKDSGIYLIVCSVSLHRYIGSAVNLNKRCAHHIAMLRANKHCNDHLQRAFNCYGEEAFSFEVLELVPDKQDLIVYEQHHIDTSRPEYNLCPIAGNSLGYRHRDEDKKIMSAKAKARERSPHSSETKEKMSRSNRGQKRPPEVGLKITKALKGKSFRPETRARMSIAHTGRKHSPETRAKIAEGNRRRVVTDAEKERLRTMNIGRKLTEEHKAKISAGGKGHKAPPISDEHKERLREINTGKKHTEEARAKMSASHIGKKRGPMSPETKAKISETKRARNAEKRNSEAMPLIFPLEE